MNPENPLPAEQNKAKPHPDEHTDQIPVLDEALDLSPELGEYEAASSATGDVEELTGEESPYEMELRVNLGYAEETEDYVENDDLAEMDEIQTLPLAEMVLDDTQDQLVSAEQKQQIATLEAIVFDGGNPNAPAPKKDRSDERANPYAEPESAAAKNDMSLQPESLTFVTPPPVSPPLVPPLSEA